MRLLAAILLSGCAIAPGQVMPQVAPETAEMLAPLAVTEAAVVAMTWSALAQMMLGEPALCHEWESDPAWVRRQMHMHAAPDQISDQAIDTHAARRCA